MPEFSKSDIELAFTVNGERQSGEFPSKDSEYSINSVACENGVTAEWDETYWGLVNIQANGNSKIKCSIDFKGPIPVVEYITKLATTSEEIVDDETSDNNLRYIGKDPNNYVQFNGEL